MPDEIDEDPIYKIMKEVSNDFFDFSKAKFPKTIENKTQKAYEKFLQERNLQKRCEIDITGFSCRARVYLLSKLIKEKPKNPIYFFIKKGKDKYDYELTLEPKKAQPGNGTLRGLFPINYDKGLTHSYICKHLQGKIDIDVSSIWQKILIQKQDGELIEATLEKDSRFLNGYSFLLDFEIARRHIKGDIHKDLPIIVCFPVIMKYLQEGDKKFSFATLSNLFKGSSKDREAAVKIVIEKAGEAILKSPKEMRELLIDFHQNDEYSISSCESQVVSPFSDCYTSPSTPNETASTGIEPI